MENNNKIKIGKKAKIAVEWCDNPINYSHEAKKNIISIMSDRYGITKESIKVSFKAVKTNDLGEQIDVSTEVIDSIQDPKFQIKLFNDYINENKIVDVDFEHIKKIDSEINSKIDYDIYDKYRKYEIDWVEFDNFLSYGEGNRIDFTKLNGLTLVTGSGENRNQIGKSSLAIDLISFLLFGKTQKPYNLSEIFNKFLDVPTFRVFGGLKIDGSDYVIERLVTRARKKTGEWGDGSQKVKYYKVINGEKEELADNTINEQGEHSIQTNKIIKEAIGSEKDFSMIVSATSDDLYDLIKTGNTEKGRLLSKWIGLFPLEEKDKLAKDKYKEFEKGLKSRTYDKTTLEAEITNSLSSIKNNEENNLLLNDRVTELNSLIKNEQETKDTLLSSKKQIDQNILKLDINSTNIKLERIKTDAGLKKAELETHNTEFETLREVQFNEEPYKEKVKLDKEISIEINEIKNQIIQLKSTNKNLIESEVCPTCKRKYDGLDNTETIKENELKIVNLTEKGISSKTKLNSNKLEIEKIEGDKKLYDRKLKLESLISIIPVQIENLRGEYRENDKKIKEYNNNKESIDQNNKIDLNLVNINAKLNSFSVERDNKLKEIENGKRNITELDKKVKINQLIITEIDGELVLIKNWKVYLEMVGKNGISKMVLKKTLPIINSELSRLLDDVCDFDVEVYLTQKNDVEFKIIKDDVASDLAGASGFEKTASALALRCVLGSISTMPKPNFIVLDEILAGVASENYDNIKNMYKKVEENYQFILHIAHIDDIKDWHTGGSIVINKTNNISSITTITNNNY